MIKRPPIDWKAVQPLNGSRQDGFEELCAQLAQQECPTGARYERNAAPDAGVECYAVFSDGSEWGWQAKYFLDALENSQWSQLDESVKTALSKHPRLTAYYVCLPRDRCDARISGRESERTRWNKRVKKWIEWATDLSISVDFRFWGSHELLDRLARPENIGRVRFWFDVHLFNHEWFAARLQEAVDSAGPRYTAELNLELEISKEFETFARTVPSFDRLKCRARAIREEFRSFQYRAKVTTGSEILTNHAPALCAEVQAVLSMLAEIKFQPVGKLPYSQILDHISKALSVGEIVTDALWALLRSNDAIASEQREARLLKPDSVQEQRHSLLALQRELRITERALEEANQLAGRSLLILRGDAGTGKTHLLCDISCARVRSGLPTVLLMGQRFTATDDPWTQALQQLDLPGLSVEEFVGALEAAAQTSRCRALVLIDAINEGQGRKIWPPHLASFIAHLERCPWIGVVLSVRSSYVETLISADLRTPARAAQLTHIGFTEHEYEAAKTFFEHYGIELPSTPLLAPEFRNPLFLKTLCLGLTGTGQRRLPRGFHGVTAIFELFLRSVNEGLAKQLGYHPKMGLVQNALRNLAKTMLEEGCRWLALDKAISIVETFLPGREFEYSFYRALVSEGVLMEDLVWLGGTMREDVVIIAYERFADYLTAELLLPEHLDLGSMVAAFAEGRLLNKIAEADVTPGLLEALCIIVPERSGFELTHLAPAMRELDGIGNAFRQSLIWRSSESFFSVTLETINDLNDDTDATIDALLTVTVIPGHPLNADFLTKRLWRDQMADRDSWWSTFLHRSWKTKGAVDRLVDWAFAVRPEIALDDESVGLCATALVWFLTTSNRFLRDRATAALVNLLTDRLGLVTGLLERFADVDDAYVTERLYAVAYGTAMRSQDRMAVGSLAKHIYQVVFAAGTPPAHILLRDYARGVIERAQSLGFTDSLHFERHRPPYHSSWPEIPSEDDIQPLLRDRTKGSSEREKLDWARNTIGFSVMHGDFAHYVLGLNYSSDWLSVRLDEPTWEPPPQVKDRLRDFEVSLSPEERDPWAKFLAAKATWSQAWSRFASEWWSKIETDRLNGSEAELQELAKKALADCPPLILALEKAAHMAFNELEVSLTEFHLNQYLKIVEMQETREVVHPPRFDISQVQRYIIWRVFNFGWTTDLFGRFDRFVARDQEREACKAERIGKKYQWIAYHEILAFVADHFQFKGTFGDYDDRVFLGPWQSHLRNIDPSCTLPSCPGGTGWKSHAPAWWGSFIYENWFGDTGEWIKSIDDLPKVEALLVTVNPRDQSRWLNLHGRFLWKRPIAPDRDDQDVERREFWLTVSGYLLQADDADAFLKWAKTVDFGSWMPDPPDVYRMFLGEHGWSPAYQYFLRECSGEQQGWRQPEHGCPVKVQTSAFGYLREKSGFDCSIDDTYRLLLPGDFLMRGLGLFWSGRGADFQDQTGDVVAFDPTAHTAGPTAFLVREESLWRYLQREKLALCWAVYGEKMALGPGYNPGYRQTQSLSGAYVLQDTGPTGFLQSQWQSWSEAEEDRHI